MRKLIYSMGVSLDGFIAGRDGEIDWSAPDEELHRFHNRQTRELGAHLCGRRLYETMLYWETAEENPSAAEHLVEYALTLLWMLKIAASVSSEMEAVLVCGRLSNAGIHSMQQCSGAGGRRWGVGGACDVYVDERDLDRAREVLNAEGVSEEELLREEERASAASTKPTKPKQGEPIESLPLKKHHFFKGFGKITEAKSKADAPDNPFGS